MGAASESCIALPFRSLKAIVFPGAAIGMTSALLWSLLTDAEQEVLLPTLVSGEFDEVARREIAPSRFAEVFLDENERVEVETSLVNERLLTVRNLMKQTGAGEDGSLWGEVSVIRGIRRSYLELLVHDRDRFLRKLEDAGYVINREPFWTIHKFDSARAVTTYSDEPSLHFANDRADEPGYGGNYFFVHWDVASVWFELARRGRGFLARIKLIERLRSALRHRNGFADPEAVSDYLKSARHPAVLS
jgi:hypothetical protein